MLILFITNILCSPFYLSLFTLLLSWLHQVIRVTLSLISTALLSFPDDSRSHSYYWMCTGLFLFRNLACFVFIYWLRMQACICNQYVGSNWDWLAILPCTILNQYFGMIVKHNKVQHHDFLHKGMKLDIYNPLRRHHQEVQLLDRLSLNTQQSKKVWGSVPHGYLWYPNFMWSGITKTA